MKAIDLFAAMDCIPEAYVHEAGSYQYKRHNITPIRFLLIAAILATLATTACAVAIRNLNWTPKEQEVLIPYNEATEWGAIAKDWYIEDVDISLSIEYPKNSELPISVNTWSQEAKGVLEVGTEYWIEKWNGEFYLELPTKDGKPWIVPQQTMECNGEYRWAVDYAQSYGQLEPGHYRLGMMIALVDPNGERSEKGCYAKFQVYTNEIIPYVDTFVNAFDSLMNGESFHIRLKTHYGDTRDKYYTTELGKSGQDYFEHSVTYLMEDDRFLWDSGYLLRNGKGYSLDWGTAEISPVPRNIESVSYLDVFNFTLFMDNFGFFRSGVDSVTEDGEEIILIKKHADTIPISNDKSDNMMMDCNEEIRIRYDRSGNIQSMFYVDHTSEYTIEAEIISENASETRAWIESIDVISPTKFSYSREMEALDQLAYVKRTSGFVSQEPMSYLNSDFALQRAKEECSRVDYNVHSVSFDDQTNMWKVEFGISWDSYIYEVIYLNSEGIPQIAASRPYPEAGEELLPKPSEWVE